MNTMNRRRFLHGAAGSAALAYAAGATALGLAGRRGASALANASGPPPMSLEALLTDTEHRTFNFFWQTTDAKRGLAPDFAPGPGQFPGPVPASIAAMGFALTALPIGVERGWVTRAQALDRAMNTLVFLRDAPQGPAAHDCSGYHGFYYHFLDMDSGTRYRDSELSTVDTALLLMGVRCCGQYFTGKDPREQQLRDLADELCERVDWPWMQVHGPAVCMGWRPESGFLEGDWIGYNEAMMLYLLALGSRAHAVGADAWEAWTSGYYRNWGTVQGVTHLTFGPLFGHQYTAVWIDLHGIRDRYMAAHGLDYFENARRAVRAQRAYAIANPLGWQGYDADVWGLSASDGPGSRLLRYHDELRQFHEYAGRGVGLLENYDDGTITPTAAIGSLPFAPEVVEPAIQTMYKRYGSVIYGEYGFLDSFNPSFTFDDVPLRSGRRVGALGWVDTRYYGINQGPIVAMIENQRSGLLWRLSRTDPVLLRGLERAGFTGGWLD